MTARRRARPPRILLYSHNGRSFGHIARVCGIAGHIKREIPEASVACVSGSRYGGHFVPEGVDLIKLPAFSSIEVPDGVVYKPMLGIPWREFSTMRRECLTAVFKSFDPDVFLVDTTARGAFFELEDILLSRPRQINILCLQGVEDRRERMLEEQRREKWVPFVEAVYDEVFCFIDRRVFDMGIEYDRGALDAKTFYAGYILRELPRLPRIRRSGPRRIVSAVGSGSQAYPLLRAIVDSRRRLPFGALYRVYTGNNLPEAQFRRLKASAHRDVSIERFTPDLVREMASADLFVGSGGYNTLAEIQYARVPSLILAWDLAEHEQLIHASRLLDLGAVNAVVPVSAVNARVVAAGIEGVFRAGAAFKGPSLALDGGRVAARRVRSILGR